MHFTLNDGKGPKTEEIIVFKDKEVYGSLSCLCKTMTSLWQVDR